MRNSSEDANKYSMSLFFNGKARHLRLEELSLFEWRRVGWGRDRGGVGIRALVEGRDSCSPDHT